MPEQTLNALLPALLESSPAPLPPPSSDGSEVAQPVPQSTDYDRRIADLEKQLADQTARAQDNRNAYQSEASQRATLAAAMEDVRQRELQRQAYERSLAPLPIPDFAETDVLDKPEKIGELAAVVRELDNRNRQLYGFASQIASQVASQAQTVTRRESMNAVDTARARAQRTGWSDFDEYWPEIERDLRDSERAQPGAAAALLTNPEAIFTTYLYHRHRSGAFEQDPSRHHERGPIATPVTPQVYANANGRVPIRNPDVRRMYAEFGLDPDKGVDAQRVSSIYGAPTAFQPGRR